MGISIVGWEVLVSSQLVIHAATQENRDQQRPGSVQPHPTQIQEKWTNILWDKSSFF